MKWKFKMLFLKNIVQPPPPAIFLSSTLLTFLATLSTY